MIVAEMRGFVVILPESGGKAGHGCNRTSALQVRKGDQIVKQFRFTVGVAKTAKDAARRARQWIDSQPGSEVKP